MSKNLKDAGINIPEFWNEEKVLEVLQTYDSFDLPEYFLVSPAAFIKLMKIVLPNKPPSQSYSKYLKEVLAVPKPKWDIRAKQVTPEQY